MLPVSAIHQYLVFFSSQDMGGTMWLVLGHWIESINDVYFFPADYLLCLVLQSSLLFGTMIVAFKVVAVLPMII